MSSLTPDRSEILSHLLDEVTGTEEAINIRQDYCRLLDCAESAKLGHTSTHHYTGSKAEGLDLPGSDDDFMLDINYIFNIKVVQSVREISDTPTYEEFLLCTENVKPGFALLRRIRQHTDVLYPYLKTALKLINNMEYLNSDEFVGKNLQTLQTYQQEISCVRQGPSYRANVSTPRSLRPRGRFGFVHTLLFLAR